MAYVIRLVSFCDFSLSAFWCYLSALTVLLYFLLSWTWGISSGCSSKVQPLLIFLDIGYLLTVTTTDLGCRVSPLGHLLLQNHTAAIQSNTYYLQKSSACYEMAGWHHWLDGCESQWTPRVGDGQGSLACCNSWGRNELDTTELLTSDLSLCLLWGAVIIVKDFSTFLDMFSSVQ